MVKLASGLAAKSLSWPIRLNMMWANSFLISWTENKLELYDQCHSRNHFMVFKSSKPEKFHKKCALSLTWGHVGEKKRKLDLHIKVSVPMLQGPCIDVCDPYY